MMRVLTQPIGKTSTKLAAGTNEEAYVDEFIRDLRSTQATSASEGDGKTVRSALPNRLLPDKVKAARFAKSSRPTS